MSEPRFQPKPGQIDYTDVKRVPVINCAVRYEGKILLVQRSSAMRLYPNHWSGVSGFLDDERGIEAKVKEELEEEAGISEDNIVFITEGKAFEEEDLVYGKTWIVHPVLVEINADEVTLNWESQDYRWVAPSEAKNFDVLKGFETVLESLGLEK